VSGKRSRPEDDNKPDNKNRSDTACASRQLSRRRALGQAPEMRKIPEPGLHSGGEVLLRMARNKRCIVIRPRTGND